MNTCLTRLCPACAPLPLLCSLHCAQPPLQDALLDPSLDLLPAVHSALTFYSLHEGVVELALRLLCTLSTRQANHDALLGSVPYIEAALRDRRARDARWASFQQALLFVATGDAMATQSACLAVTLPFAHWAST